MKQLWWRWQSLVAILLFFLNVDFVVMPGLTQVGVHGWPLFYAAVVWATVEVCYWNWYARWLVRNVGRSEHARRTAGSFTQYGLRGRFLHLIQVAQRFVGDSWNWFVDHALANESADGVVKKRVLNAALDVVKGTHILMTYPMMLGLGLLPMGWAVGIVLQRLMPVPGAFQVLLAANAVKTYVLGLLYLLLPLWGKIFFLLSALGFVIWSTHRVVHQVKKIQPLAAE